VLLRQARVGNGWCCVYRESLGFVLKLTLSESSTSFGLDLVGLAGSHA
jgi:hypothetical protein